MRLYDSIRTAGASVRHAKMRSVLTMLGVVIGIASVILLMSIGQSAQDLILNQIKGIGSNLVFVIPGATKGSRFASPPSVLGIVIKTLKKNDLESLQREPSIVKAAGELHGSARVIYGNNDTTVTYTGVTGDYFDVINLKAGQGSLISKEDDAAFSRVAVLGPELVKTLFGEVSPLGKSVRLKDLAFKVVGVIEKKGLGVFGADLDNMMFIPMSVAQKQLQGVDHFGGMAVQADDSYTIEFVKARMISILRQNHQIDDPNKDDFTIRTQEDALALMGSITGILTVFLTSIAFISLVVGGIGIMNIMLVSVIERTREIGLRKAVGATNNDILQQFLWEAIILTVVGGFVGIFFGAFFTGATYLLLVNVMQIDWVFALPPAAIGLAVGVSMFTGLIFGLYPARQAAKKNPIDALRYE